jgi:hypothetical protein
MKRPWRRKLLPTGKPMTEEARRLGVSLEALPHRLPTGTHATPEVNPANEPEIQSRVRNARAEQRNAILSIAQTFGTIFTLLLTLGLALWNARRESKRESGDMMIKFEEMLNSGSERSYLEGDGYGGQSRSREVDSWCAGRRD